MGREAMNELDVKILRLLARGYSIKQAAAHLGYSVFTIYPYVGAIRASLGVATEAAAVVEALRLGVIEMPDAGEMVRAGGWVQAPTSAPRP